MLTLGDVQLLPLEMAHVAGLRAAVADGGIGRIPHVAAPEPDEVDAWVCAALAAAAQGRQQPFTVQAGGRIVGSTRLYDIDPSVPNCAIGHTFYAASVQRTHVNTSCKRLLLGHAFDTLGMQAVYFHTSHLNLRSRAAIERLGATLDGVLRRHKRHKDGSLRDTWSYSIVADEWPAIRDRLDARLLAR